MKKIFLMTALAAGILSSCSEDDTFMQSSVNSNAIAFATKQVNGNLQTRSGETINTIDKFTVSSVNADNTPYFNNEEYIYNAGEGVFKSQTPHYWPTTGTLSFYAISHIGSYTADANNIPTYTYQNWAAEKDLVAATVKAGEKTIPYPLNFRHLTSQVCVSAEAEDKTEELTYKLVSVKMEAPSTGTYYFADATGGVGSWSIDNSKTSEYSYEEALPRSFRQHGMIELTSTYWNILPVTDGTIHFAVEYQVYQNDRIIADLTGKNAKECVILNPGLIAGKRYMYNFILTRSTTDEITFTLTVNDWEEGNSTNQELADLPKDPLKYIYSSTGAKAGVTFDTEKYTGVINIPETTEKDGVVYDVTYIATNAFKNCTEVTAVTIPESVTYIQDGAFEGCTGLTTLSIPSKVYSIGEKAFKGCTGLTTMEIPTRVERLKKSVFEGCTGLTSFSVPTSVTIIEETAFKGCSNLASVSIPGSVTSVGDYAFQGCTSLPVIDGVRYADTYLVSLVDNDLKECNIKDGTRFIGNGAFWHTGITSVNIPETVILIDSDAFQGCSGLTSLVIPGSVRTIDDRAFCYCSGLTSLTLSEGVVYLGESSFEGCSKLSSVSVPNSVRVMQATVFENCSKLTGAQIGSSIEVIGNMVFYGCPLLQAVGVRATYPPSVGSMTFPSTIGGIYVPWDSEESYKSSWYEYSDKIRGN